MRSTRRASTRRRRSGIGAEADAADAALVPDRSVDMGKMHGYLGYLLRRAQMLAYADFIAELTELNLSPGQFGVLTVIDTNPGLRQSEVSAALGIQKTNFVAVLNGFERRGLAVRKSAAGDRRSYALYLTPAGKTLLKRARAAQARHERRLVERLGEQGRVQLLGLLEKLTQPT
jgi:DNA-binding MarR family transcriptional regulator